MTRRTNGIVAISNVALTRMGNYNKLSVYLLLVSIQMVKGAVFYTNEIYLSTFQNAASAKTGGWYRFCRPTVSTTNGASNLVQVSETAHYI